MTRDATGTPAWAEVGDEQVDTPGMADLFEARPKCPQCHIDMYLNACGEWQCPNSYAVGMWNS